MSPCFPRFPELFLEPATLEKPIPAANSTELPLNPPEEIGNQDVQVSLEPPKALSMKESSLSNAATEKKKRPIAKSRKRAMSESHAKSGVPPSKIAKILPTPTHFKCKTCPSLAFEKIEEYRQHVKETHPKMKFFCDLCAFVTVNSTNITRHKTHLHTYIPNNGHECKLCGISYPKRNGLSLHVKNYH